MKKGIIGIIIVVVVLAIAAFVFKDKIFKSNEISKEDQIATIKKDPLFSSLKVLKFDDLEKKIKNNEDFVAYFAWPYNCGDSRNFELHSFNDYLKDTTIKDKIYLIDMDDEAPDALADHALREPIAKRFLIDTWTKDASLSPMELKAPQIVHYKDGKIENLVSWTVPNNDDDYGIKKELTDAFFNTLK